ncbi:MAG: hypothetical protein LAQ30_16950 [Acidobacteriia bacterium]|nr:hypothetical protein [Terriglobia bacterium]
MRTRQKGQAAIFVSMSIVVTLGMLGLVVDLGWALWRKQACKQAAQAAVMAGIKVAQNAANFVCPGGGVPCMASPIPCPAVLDTPSNPIHTACLYAKQNGFVDDPAHGRQRVLIEAFNGTPPTPGLHPTYWISATVSERVPVWFSAVVGTGLTVRARATAAYFLPSVGGCIYALEPDGIAVTNSGNTELDTGCGMYVNSISGSAIDLNGNPIIHATNNSNVNIVGSCNGCDRSLDPPSALRLGAPRIVDPFGGMAPPDVGSCNVSGGVILASHDTATLNPGVICGGINLSGQASLTFNPGLYIIKGGFSASGQVAVTGSGVTFYVVDGAVNLSGGTSMSLTAPTGGYWQGILFFQARDNYSAASLVGGSEASLNGVLYFPGAALNFGGGSAGNAWSATIVSRTLSLVGNTYISDPVTTKFTSGNAGVRMIE